MELEERKFIMSIIVDKADAGMSFSYEIATAGGGGSSQGGSSAGDVKSSFETIYAKNLEEAEKKLYFKEGAYIDYSHMKVLILEKVILEDMELVKNIVTEMSNNVEFAENIVVCAIRLDKEIDSEVQYGKKIEQITKNQENFKNIEVFRFDKMFSLGKGALTIPLIDTEVNMLGSAIVTDELVYWEYQD